ncbi:MAG: hypothetical protein EOO61_08540 [Hymenobacter sp.]|nr:MAG: hypothetical protein EOO61_08540 [Hymenobacter sp.]
MQQQDLALYLEEAETKRVPLVRTHYDNREDMFDRHSYQKGGRVLHMLRQQVGDDAFFTALNRYLTENKFKAVDISRLRVAFEETTGEDLGWFFEQWFMQRGHPELKVSHSYAAGQVRLRVQQAQDTVYQPVFRLPVTVTVWQKEKPADYHILVTKVDQTFTIPITETPTLVKFDSEGQLLAQVDEQRTQEELVFQFYHARGYWQKAESLNELQNKTTDFAVSGLMRNALQDKFFAVRRLALDHLRGYRGPTANTVRSEIQRIATADPSSAVRAQAIITLASFPTENFLTTYTAALRDSSYLVEAAAIGALTKVPNTASIRPQLAILDNTPNTSLVVALASYYAQRGTIEQYEWYLRRLPDLTDNDLYTYLPSFGTFMTQMPVIERERGLKALEELARHHGSYIVRLGAYHGLMNLVSSQPELKTKLLDIKTKETDDRLKSLYNLM